MSSQVSTAAAAPATPRPQPQQRRSLSALLNIAVDHAHLLSYILIAAGLLGLLALPLLERKINFDENALLAGSARPTIRSKSPHAYQAGKALAASLQSSLFTGNFTAALQHQLKQHLPSVQVYNHTFTYANWGGSGSGWGGGGGSSHVRVCTNVHVVLSAPRGDGKEALLLGTPINHQDFATDFEQDTSGALLALSLGGALLHHLSLSAPWLAKEVVWLLPDASCGLVGAVQAWADAYQNPPLSDPTMHHFGRAGVLQQAVLLELPSGSLNTLQASLESYEGLLPKLDMFWLFRWYCYHYVRAPLELTYMGWTFSSSTLQRLTQQVAALLDPLLPGSSRAVHQALQAVQQHILKFTMACQFMWRQARGLPTGAHAPFKGLMVDAATLRILCKDPEGYVTGPAGFTGATGNRKRTLHNSSSATGRQGPQPQYVLGFDDVLAQLGDVVELTLRSCNVLIERFHHSLFLYVMTDLDHYVSVERYIGPLVALICVLAVQAAATCGSPAATADSLGMLVRQLSQMFIQLKRHWREGPGIRQRLIKLGYYSGRLLWPLTWLAALRHRSASVETLGLKERFQRKFHACRAFLVLLWQLEPMKEGREEEPTLLEPIDMLRLPSQEQAAAARVQWVAAIKVVAAAHILASAVGYAMRGAPLLMPLLQQPGSAAVWLAAAAEAPGQHVRNLGVGCGVLLALLAAADGLMSAPCSSSDRTDQGGAGNGNSVLLRKVFAVEYSVAAAACAAAACLNWALGFVVCLVLAPLAVACAPSPLQDKASAGSSSTTSRSWWPCFGVVCCSPPVLLLVLVALSGDCAAGGVQWFGDLVLHSSVGTLMAFWALYIPCWSITAWSVAAARKKAGWRQSNYTFAAGQAPRLDNQPKTDALSKGAIYC